MPSSMARNVYCLDSAVTDFEFFIGQKRIVWAFDMSFVILANHYFYVRVHFKQSF